MGCGQSNTAQVDAADQSVHNHRLSAVKQSQRQEELEVQHAGQHLSQNIVHTEVTRTIDEIYHINGGVALGTGISGTVRAITHKDTGIKYALKTLHLDQIRDQDGMQQLRDEIDILCQLDHPNIVRLEEVYETPDYMYLVLELCTGGELLDRLNSLKDRHYTEKDACDYVKTMVNALRYVHDHNITHRDLKLENFLLQDQTEHADLKLIDFGLSRHFKADEKLHVAVGTPYYVAPEVLRGTYNEKCDLWSVGVITYMLLSGTPPFHGRDETHILQAVKSGKYVFHPDLFDDLSDNCKDFISKLLVLEPNDRLSAKQAQEHPWLHDWDEERKPLSHTIGISLMNFHNYSAMKKMVCEVLAYTLIPEQITDLRSEFEKIDVDKTGEFTIEQFRTALRESEHISDEECDQIFMDMDIEHEGKIHWHEFIAATLAKCEVDDRNMKLAFDKLDHNHQGFLTVNDLKDILGKDKSESDVKAMFDEVDTEHEGKITYAQFVKIMKGPSQTKKEGNEAGRDTFGGVNQSGGSEESSKNESCKHQQRQDNMNTIQMHNEKLRLANEKVSASKVRRNSAACSIPLPAFNADGTIMKTKQKTDVPATVSE